MSDKTPNPSAGILWFILLTTLYFPIKYYRKSDETAVSFIYILFVIAIEFFINFDLTKKICETGQLPTAIFVTAIPWILIFGVFNLMIMLFAGWLPLFSNTFGYGIAKLMGVSSTMNELFVKSKDGSKSKKGELKLANEMLAQICMHLVQTLRQKI